MNENESTFTEVQRMVLIIWLVDTKELQLNFVSQANLGTLKRGLEHASKARRQKTNGPH